MLAKCNEDGVCDKDENRIDCPQECSESRKDNICQNIEDGVCRTDPDCEGEDSDCIFERKEKESIYEPETIGKKPETSTEKSVSQNRDYFKSKNRKRVRIIVYIFFILILLVILVLVGLNFINKTKR